MKVNINGFIYNIVEVEKTSIDSTLGVCDNESQTIEINQRSKQNKR